MGKKALCINKADAWAAGIMLDKTKPYVYPFYESLYGLPVKLIDRDICETDPKTLQLIPYIVVQRGDYKIFTYTRGNATGEERLKAKLSIGLGGHVDEAPTVVDAFTLLRLEACRELQEEIGIDVEYEQINFQGLIYEEMEEVGKVHLGLFAWYKQDVIEIKQEEGHIEKGEWLSIDELMKPEIYNRLELWSRAVVDHIIDDIASDAAAFGD